MTLSEEFAEAFSKRDWMGAFIIAIFFVIWLPFKLLFALIHSFLPFLKFVSDEAKVIREEHQGSSKIEGRIATRELLTQITTPELKDPEDIFANLIETADPTPSREIIRALADFFNELYDLEELAKLPKAPPPCSPDSIEAIRYRDAMRLHIARFRDPDAIQVIYMYVLYEIVKTLMKYVPASHHLGDEDEKPAQFTIPLHTLITDPTLITEFCEVCNEEKAIELHLFLKIRKRIEENKKLIEDKKLKLSTFEETMEAYLKGTPFLPLLKAKVGFEIPDAFLPEHRLVVASTGTGKSQFIQADAYHYLQREERPGIVIIDSQGTMLPKFERLGLWRDDLVIIDPEDISPPALNMFALPERIKSYDRNTQEVIESATIQLFGFLFAALDQTLTGRQATFFSFVTRLVLSIPGATIRTLREVLEEEPKTPEQSSFWQYVQKLDPDAQAFFKIQFYQKGYNVETKRGIVQRLYGVLRVPAFNRMFTSSDNKLDLFRELNAGKTILINTSKSLLGNDASSVFGRYCIAQTLSAVFQRVAIKPPYRLALLYIDESADYFQDETLATLFTQARKYELGALIAFQNLQQMPGGLAPVVLANTTTKLVAGLTDRDARALATDMRTSPEWLLSLRKHKDSSEFGCFIRNYTPAAVRLTIPFGMIENAPMMSKEEHEALRQRNRERYGTSSSAIVNHESSLSQTHQAPAKKPSNEVPPLQPTTISTTTPPPAPHPATDPHAGVDD